MLESALPLEFRRATVLVLADVFGFSVVVFLSFWFGFVSRWLLIGIIRAPELNDPYRIVVMYLPALMILLMRSGLAGHYTQFKPFWAETQDIIKTVLVIAAFDAFILFVMGVLFSRLWFGFFLIGLATGIPLVRFLTRKLMIALGIWFTPTCIVGVGDNAMNTFEALRSDISLGHDVVGFVDLNASSETLGKLRGKPVYASLDSAAAAPARDRVNRFVFAFDSLGELDKHRGTLNQYIADHPYTAVSQPPMGLPLYGASVVGIFRHDTTILRIENNLNNPWSRRLKRASDILFGVIIILVLMPVLLIIAWLVSRDGGPVLYRHKRVGRNGKKFECLKFRTMAEGAEQQLQSLLESDPALAAEWDQHRKLKDDPRATRMGRYLRKTSVDELPQLWSVLRGEMSLVGPRPITQEECDSYGGYLPYYYAMTPGITGLWQVSGRSDNNYEQRIRLDVWYSRNWSLWNDIVILVQTVRTLIKRHGAY